MGTMLFLLLWLCSIVWICKSTFQITAHRPCLGETQNCVPPRWPACDYRAIILFSK
jgi:hypothetical protein